MNTQNQLIDDVVRNVLRQLRAGQPAGRPTAESAPVPVVARAAAPPSAAVSAPPSSPAMLVLDDAVVTEQSLAKRLAGVKTVAFSARTVLTPSARDWLRGQGIEWTRSAAAGAGGSAAAAAGGARIIVTHSTIAVGSAFPQPRLVRVSETEARRLIVESADSACVLLLTNRPHAMAVELNRHTQVRAVALDDLQRAQCVVTEAEANCVCVRPNGRSAAELRDLEQAIAAVGSRR